MFLLLVLLLALVPFTSAVPALVPYGQLFTTRPRTGRTTRFGAQIKTSSHVVVDSVAAHLSTLSIITTATKRTIGYDTYIEKRTTRIVP